jgi:hypothetical protein
MYEYNHMKLRYFVLKVRLLFTDLFWIRIRIRFRIRIRIRIQNVYIGSGSDPDLAKSFGSIRIRNTAVIPLDLVFRWCFSFCPWRE